MKGFSYVLPHPILPSKSKHSFYIKTMSFHNIKIVKLSKVQKHEKMICEINTPNGRDSKYYVKNVERHKLQGYGSRVRVCNQAYKAITFITFGV